MARYGVQAGAILTLVLNAAYMAFRLCGAGAFACQLVVQCEVGMRKRLPHQHAQP